MRASASGMSPLSESRFAYRGFDGRLSKSRTCRRAPHQILGPHWAQPISLCGRAHGQRSKLCRDSTLACVSPREECLFVIISRLDPSALPPTLYGGEPECTVECEFKRTRVLKLDWYNPRSNLRPSGDQIKTPTYGTRYLPYRYSTVRYRANMTTHQPDRNPQSTSSSSSNCIASSPKQKLPV